MSETNHPLCYVLRSQNTGVWSSDKGLSGYWFMQKQAESAACVAQQAQKKSQGFCTAFDVIRLEGNIVENGTGLCIPRQTIVAVIDRDGKKL